MRGGKLRITVGELATLLFRHESDDSLLSHMDCEHHAARMLAADALYNAAKEARDRHDRGIVAIDWLPDSPLRAALALADGKGELNK